MNLLALFRSHGHDLKREGKSYKTCCPFHNDSTPSLSIDPQKSLWHCFGCNEGGDGITFLEKSLGLKFGEAADRWRELSGEEPRHSKPKTRSSEASTRPRKEDKTMNQQAGDIPNEAPAGRLTSEDLTFFSRLQDLYSQELSSNDDARSYLKDRGLTDGETIRAFGLGYVSGKSLPQLAPAQRARLEDIGILNDKGNETLYGCIVCPLYDIEGNVVSFLGRRISEGGNPHRALSGPLRGFVNYQAARGSQQVILVEGFLDALACYQAGLRNTIPVGGACSRLDLVKLLHKEGVQEVLLALDPDEAGDEGATNWAAELEKRGIGSVRVRLDYDPCEFFQRGGTAATFRSHVADAEVLSKRSDDSEFLLDSNELLYRVRALGRQAEDKLKVRILVSAGDNTHRDLLNLYSHKMRKTFANAIATRFHEFRPSLNAARVEADLERIIDGLEQRARQKSEEQETRDAPTMSPDEKAAATAYLTESDLVTRLQDDMSALGYVGEEEAKLLVYLIATSRKLPRPLSGIIGSGSGAGKSFLAELAEQLTPPEEVELFSKLSSQALYYLPKDYLCRKLLILEERAGGEGADYAIRTLQTKDRLTQMVTLKDAETGKMSAKHYEVMGPIAYLETTTQSYLNPENTSRCFEIPLDESAEQTRRIHEHQRQARALSGLSLVISRDTIKRRHHNAQRILQQVRVVIPYAKHLTFPARYLRTRRDHERFLLLIEVVAFLHQFQRPQKSTTHKGREVQYIEAIVEDYAIAYKLALRVLWVSLDELSRWARELIDSCRGQVEEACAHNPKLIPLEVHWTRRQLREYLGWPDKRLRLCLDELVSLEYLQTLDGSKGKAFIYRLNPDFSHSPKALGLLTPEQLQAKLDSSS